MATPLSSRGVPVSPLLVIVSVTLRVSFLGCINRFLALLWLRFLPLSEFCAQVVLGTEPLPHVLTGLAGKWLLLPDNISFHLFSTLRLYPIAANEGVRPQRLLLVHLFFLIQLPQIPDQRPISKFAGIAFADISRLVEPFLYLW